jgi:hypothetical protein
MKEQETGSAEGMLRRMQVKWGVDNLWQVIVILAVFSITGLTVVLMRKYLFTWLGFNDETAWWIKTFIYILFIFPAYQVLILVYGAIFGQFRFFWEKEKKLARAISRLFVRSPEQPK